MADEQPIELAIDGVLDLHTFAPGETRELVADYLNACRDKGILAVRIIHGKGARSSARDCPSRADPAPGREGLSNGVRSRRRLGSDPGRPAPSVMQGSTPSPSATRILSLDPRRPYSAPMPLRVEPGTFHELGPFDIPGLPPPRRVRVYVPKGRIEGAARPALYLFDGQNVFGDEGSFAGGWYADRAVDRLIPARAVVAPVVVGLDHGGAARIDELGPWRDGDKGGQLDNLLDWMVGTLMPLIQSRFSTTPGPLGAVIGGSSMGGLASMYAHFKRPDAFGGALSMSPSFWFARGQIIDMIRRSPRPPLSRIYLDCGLREGGGRMFDRVKDVAELLKSRGYPPEQLMWRPDPRGAHGESIGAGGCRRPSASCSAADRPCRRFDQSLTTRSCSDSWCVSTHCSMTRRAIS